MTTVQTANNWVRQKNISVLVILGFLSLGACDDYSRIYVAGQDFCVPNENYVDSDILLVRWWAPKAFQSRGFRFRVSIGDANPEFRSHHKSDGTEIFGLVDELEGYKGWKYPSPPAPHWIYLTASQTVHAPILDGRYMSAKQPLNQLNYFVWRPAGTKLKVEEGFQMSDELIASCDPRLKTESEGRRLAKTSFCDRVVYFDNVAIVYSFEDEFLAHIDQMDRQVIKSIKSWICPKNQ